MIETFEIFLSAPIGLQVIILAIPISFYLVGSWLHDGYKIDKAREEENRQARLDIAFKIAKQTEENRVKKKI
jgi:hypothetical protein